MVHAFTRSDIVSGTSTGGTLAAIADWVASKKTNNVSHFIRSPLAPLPREWQNFVRKKLPANVLAPKLADHPHQLINCFISVARFDGALHAAMGMIFK